MRTKKRKANIAPGSTELDPTWRNVEPEEYYESLKKKKDAEKVEKVVYDDMKAFIYNGRLDGARVGDDLFTDSFYEF